MAEEEQKRIHSPHDALVRSILGRKDSAVDFFRRQLPSSLEKRIDWTTLKRVSGSFVTEEMRSIHSDLIFEAALQDRRLFFYCLLEHQSTVDPLMPFRLLSYLVHLLANWVRDHPRSRSLPAVIPVVLYSGSEPWRISRQMADLIDLPDDLRESLLPFQPRFEHLLLDLSRLEMEQIGGEIVLRTMLMLLKAVAANEVEPWLDKHGAYLIDILNQRDGRSILQLLLRYICQAGSGASFSTVTEKLRRLESQPIREALMTIADELIQKGRLEGQREGRQEGRQEGRIEGWRIGCIHTLQGLLGLDLTPMEVLSAKSASDLEKIESELRRQFRRQSE